MLHVNIRVAKAEKKAMCWKKPSQSPDLDLTEMLWQDLNRAVHKQLPSNIHKLKQHYKELRISPKYYETDGLFLECQMLLVCSYFVGVVVVRIYL